MYANYWNLSQEESLDFGEISRRTENAEKGLDEAGFLDPARVFLLTPAGSGQLTLSFTQLFFSEGDTGDTGHTGDTGDLPGVTRH